MAALTSIASFVLVLCSVYGKYLDRALNVSKIRHMKSTYQGQYDQLIGAWHKLIYCSSVLHVMDTFSTLAERELRIK